MVENTVTLTIAAFIIGALSSSAAFGLGLGTFLTTKTLTRLADELKLRMDEDTHERNPAS